LVPIYFLEDFCISSMTLWIGQNLRPRSGTSAPHMSFCYNPDAPPLQVSELLVHSYDSSRPLLTYVLNPMVYPYFFHM
jgi:hypothetical protein